MATSAEVEMEGTRARLGAGFWVPWSAGMAALAAGAFGLPFWLKQTLSGQAAVPMQVCAVVAFTVALIWLGMLPQKIKVRRGLEAPVRAPQRRYLARFVPAMIGYAVLLAGAVWVWKTAAPTGVLAWAVAAAPAVPLLLAVRAIALLIFEEDDEFQRARQMHVFVWATCATLVVCSVYGFLDMFGVVPDVELWAVFAIWAVCLCPAQIAAKIRFG
jgi:hypothetical protein